MIKREYWLKLINDAWKRRSVIWLKGIRRVGKTSLCQQLEDTLYFDCELPRVRHQLEDPEFFFQQHLGKKLVFDEIHRLDNPSELLKIAADHFKGIKIIATGSSSLSASSKFSDTLTGRKTEIWLTPMLFAESSLFGNLTLEHRLLYGGLPPFFQSEELPNKDLQEWMDSYWAKDIQGLFKLEKRVAFLKFFELILSQSGEQFEATRFTSPCEVSRQTIRNYLGVLEETYVAYVIRPFSSHKPTEIISAPKVYGFDTAFVAFSKGWDTLRKEDIGILWEHLVLNEIYGRCQTKNVFYWRDKQNHEIDFVYLKQRNKKPITIECKSQAKKFEPKNLGYFRKIYPDGENYVVALDVKGSYKKVFNNMTVVFCSLKELIKNLNDH